MSVQAVYRTTINIQRSPFMMGFTYVGFFFFFFRRFASWQNVYYCITNVREERRVHSGGGGGWRRGRWSAVETVFTLLTCGGVTPTRARGGTSGGKKTTE